MNNLEAVAGSGIITGPLGGAHCGAQGQAPDPAHAIDTNFHP
jgi:hypothetical protein